MNLYARNSTFNTKKKTGKTEKHDIEKTRAEKDYQEQRKRPRRKTSQKRQYCRKKDKDCGKKIKLQKVILLMSLRLE